MVDVTCDSDGIIDRFVDLKDVKDVLELHDLTDEPYYLAIFLAGAYQEVMGSYHNLFGQPNEAQVVLSEGGRYHITKIIPGSTVGEMLQFARYDTGQSLENFRKLANRQVQSGSLDRDAAEAMTEEYAADVKLYTYLENGEAR
jgi:arginine decarboxylase